MHTPQKWRQKPPPGTPIDRSNSLSQGLYFFTPLWEGGGVKVNDIMTGMDCTFPVGKPIWTPGTQGIGLAFNSVSTYTQSKPIPSSIQYVFPLTLACGFRTEGGSNLNAALCGIQSNVINFSFASTNYLIRCNYNTGGTSRTLSTAANIVLPTYSDNVVSVSLSHQSAAFYINGIKYALSSGPTLTPDPIYPTPASFELGSINVSPSSNIYWMGVWNRALQGSEHFALTTNPWQMFKKRQIPLYGGGSTTLAINFGFMGQGNVSENLNTLLQPMIIYVGMGNFATNVQQQTVAPGAGGGYFNPIYFRGFGSVDTITFGQSFNLNS